VWQGQAGNVGYCTTKSGLINFTRSMAMELALYGIRVKGLTPMSTMPEDPSWSIPRSGDCVLAASGRMDFDGASAIRAQSVHKTVRRYAPPAQLVEVAWTHVLIALLYT
jgi:NAD(P)-dependent dehydrogenase (short-subunit alcohol dehydrogenase family)